jgi:TPR repeat protein
MLATLRNLLLVSIQAIALSACKPAQVSADLSEVISQADAAYAGADYLEALRLYGLAAERGDAIAQTKLGSMYDTPPQGVTYNPSEALRWYRLAADQGSAKAQTNLGLLYEEGRGVAENYAEAVRWHRLAADQGFAEAQRVNGGPKVHQPGGVKVHHLG